MSSSIRIICFIFPEKPYEGQGLLRIYLFYLFTGFFVRTLVVSRFFAECCIIFFPQGSQAKLHSLTPAQKAYMSSLSQGLDTIESAEKDLGTPAQIPALGSDPVSPFYA